MKIWLPGAQELKAAKEYGSDELNKAVWEVVNTFSSLDKKSEEAEHQPYAFNRLAIKEAIEKYALEVAKNERLLRVIKTKRPELHKRIEVVLEQEQVAEL